MMSQCDSPAARLTETATKTEAGRPARVPWLEELDSSLGTRQHHQLEQTLAIASLVAAPLDRQFVRQSAVPEESAHDVWGLGVLRFDGMDQLVYANELGARLLRSGKVLVVRDRRLHAVDAIEDEALSHAFALCWKLSQTEHVLVGSSRAEETRYACTLMPGPEVARCATLPQVKVTCLLAPIDRRRVATVRQLMALFKLTAAEARLARAVASGEALDDYACSNDLCITTVRSQLRAAFAKTGVGRQQELVRLVSAIPSNRHA